MGVIQILVEAFLDLLTVLAVQHLVLQVRQLVGDLVVGVLRVRLHFIIVERDHFLGAALSVLVYVQILVQVLDWQQCGESDAEKVKNRLIVSVFNLFLNYCF